MLGYNPCMPALQGEEVLSSPLPGPGGGWQGSALQRQGHCGHTSSVCSLDIPSQWDVRLTPGTAALMEAEASPVHAGVVSVLTPALWLCWAQGAVGY